VGKPAFTITGIEHDGHSLGMHRLHGRVRLAREERHTVAFGGWTPHTRNGEWVAEAGIEPSVGSVCNSDDNALAETINALFEAEAIHRRGPWRNSEAVEYATLTWGDWFNTRRLLEPIGNVPPAQAAANYYAANEQLAMAA